MAEQFDDETLTALVRAHLPTHGAMHVTPIGTGKHNSSFWIDGGWGRLVLRLAPPDDAGFLFYERRMMRQEPSLHALIRSKTSIPVADVIAYDFSRTRIDRDYLLMTALPGTPMSDIGHLSRAGHARVLREVGKHLRQLHDLTAQDCLATHAYGYLGEHRPMEPQPTWRAAFVLMWNLLLDDVVACGAYSEAEAQGMRDLLDTFVGNFDHPVRPSLLHMDVWSQNILVDASGHVTGLVDFDRALWGDVEIEYAVLDYCGISEPAFWEGYGMARDESEAALIRRQFYLLYEIQKYMPIAIWRGRDWNAAMRSRQSSFELAASLGFKGA